MTRGEWIQCSACAGHGVVSGYTMGGDFAGPMECRGCCNGGVWRYPSGALAKYPGGPFVGRDDATTVVETPK